MKKRITAILLSVCLVLGMENGIAYAASSSEPTENAGIFEGTEGDYDYRLADDGTVEITYYAGNEENIVVPREIGGGIVTKIGAEAFKGCSNMTNITLPDTLTTIGVNAFVGCFRLKNIALPDGVTYISPGAFQSCRALTEVTVPESVTNIGSYAFSGCSSLESFTIPGKITRIEELTFSGCSALTEVIIPEGVNTIGARAFSGCSSLTEIHLPDSAVYLEDYVFSECSSLTYVQLPNAVTSLPMGIFQNCSSLTGIMMADRINEIGESAFKNCTSLTEILIPFDVTSIKGETFSGCTNLAKVEILGNKVNSIWYDAFGYCTNLTDITLPSGLIDIGENAFRYCSSLSQITLPDRLATIGYGAFQGCTGLKEIAIPDSVTSISQGVFAACDGLEKITVAERNIRYDSREDCNGIVETAENRLHTGCKTTVIPESVATIGGYAFERYGHSSIKIPVTVTDIEDYAFDWSEALQDVFYEGSVEEWEAVHIGDFNDYLRDASIHYQTTGEPGIPESDYRYCLADDGTMVITGYIGKDTGIVVPDMLAGRKVTSLGEEVLAGSSLTDVVLPNTIKEIPTHAFLNSSIQKITIPEEVTVIGWEAFLGCTALTDVFYAGSAASWKNMQIPEGNEALQNAVIHYGKECSHSATMIQDERAATCSETGYTGDTYCMECGVLLEKGQKTPLAPHTVVKDVAKAATCTKSGLTVGSHCAVCGKVIRAQGYIPEKGHSYQTIKKAATFTRNGSIVTKCTVCGKEKSKVIIYRPRSVKLSAYTVSYTGRSRKPSVTVKDSRGNVISNKNFTITYTNNKNIGTATVTITGKGNYSGTVTKKFKIVPKKGSTFTVGSYKYEITSSSTAAFVGVKSSSKTTVNVANTVKIGGKTFKVTSIKSKALYKKTKVTQVTIGANVKTIGSNAFYGCSKLKKITIKSTVLKTISKTAFKGIKSGTVIKVPSRKLTAYKKLLKGKGQSSKVKIIK